MFCRVVVNFHGEVALEVGSRCEIPPGKLYRSSRPPRVDLYLPIELGHSPSFSLDGLTPVHTGFRRENRLMSETRSPSNPLSARNFRTFLLQGC